MGRQVMESLIAEIMQRINLNRRLLLVVNTDLFREIWMTSNEQDRQRISEMINTLKVEELRIWLDSHPDKELELCKNKHLRYLGQCYRVKNYDRLTRAELIAAIRKKISDYEKARASVSHYKLSDGDALPTPEGKNTSTLLRDSTAARRESGASSVRAHFS